MSKVKIWIQAGRPFSFTASMVPVVLGAAIGYAADGEFRWTLLPIVIICSILFHAGTNVLNDYFDFKNSVDKDYTFGGSRVLPNGLLTPRQVFIGGLTMFGIGILLGALLIYIRGWWMFAIGVAGFLGGIFYTAKPLGYKYIGLGDLMVFVLMGPLMVIGSYFALTGSFAWDVLWISLPVGFLVAAILWANNLRDIKYDKEAGVKTLAMMLGIARAKKGYYLLVLSAFICVVALVGLKILSIFGLLVMISLPIAIKDIKAAGRAEEEKPEISSQLDVETAKLHLAFGILLIVSIVIGGL